MQRILVPCDFSGSAVEGLKFAAELAAANDGAIIVLSVVREGQEGNEQSVSERFREKFDEIAKETQPGVRMLQKIRFGKLIPIVIDVIAKEHIDLIVIGTRGSRGWEGAFMGSNVEKIVRTSPVPVFAVRRESHLRNIKNIVFPCDLIFSDHRGISGLKNLQGLLGARLHLLRIDTSGLTDQTILLERMKEYASFHGLSKYTVNIVGETDEKDGILHFAREINADMIAMTTHGADLGHLYMSSIAADVVNHANLLTWTCMQQPEPSFMGNK